MTTMFTGAITDTNGAADLSKAGAQLGNDSDFKNVAHSTPYVQQPPRVVVTRPPGWMLIHREKDRLITILVELIERQAKSWTGFTANTDISTHQVAVGWDNQMMTIPLNRQRQAITPTMTTDAKTGAADIKFWKYYLDTAISHPNLNGPNFAELESVPDAWTVDMFTFDVLVYEPSNTGKSIVWSMACAGLWPSTDIETTMDRIIADPRKGQEYSISFPAIYQEGPKVDAAALVLESALKSNSINPLLKASYFEEVDSRIVALNAGILQEINDHATSDKGQYAGVEK